MTDVIVFHPRTIVYPLWMYYMNKYRDSFDKIIVAMTAQGDDEGIEAYLARNIEGVTILPPVNEPGDWRNNAAHEALKHSDSDNILFLEQDFLVQDREFSEPFTTAYFFDDLNSYMLKYDVVGIDEKTRFHPCCLLMKKTVLDQTSKDFSARPPEHDHFGGIYNDLKKHRCYNLRGGNWLHLQGLSQNYTVAPTNPEQVHRPDQFYAYNKYILDVPIEHYPPFVDLVNKIPKQDNEEIRRYFTWL